MRTVSVPLSTQSYEVRIGRGLLQCTGDAARELFPEGKSCAVVTDTNVAPLHGQSVMDSLRTAGFAPLLISVPAGEPSKSFVVLE